MWWDILSDTWTHLAVIGCVCGKNIQLWLCCLVSAAQILSWNISLEALVSRIFFIMSFRMTMYQCRWWGLNTYWIPNTISFSILPRLKKKKKDGAFQNPLELFQISIFSWYMIPTFGKKNFVSDWTKRLSTALKTKQSEVFTASWTGKQQLAATCLSATLNSYQNQSGVKSKQLPSRKVFTVLSPVLLKWRLLQQFLQWLLGLQPLPAYRHLLLELAAVTSCFC